MDKRSHSVKDIIDYKPNNIEFDGKWRDSIGLPELIGSWIIWGNSVNGKTRYALQLAKYLAKFVRVDYNSLEEGLCSSFRKAVIDVGFTDPEVKKNFHLISEPIDELERRLSKQRSAQVVIIDSLQYTGMSYTDYKKLRKKFPRKLFIFISHADGREPKGNIAKSVRYDAFVKIYVEAYRAYPQSRYGGGEPYVIWEKGANSVM